MNKLMNLKNIILYIKNTIVIDLSYIRLLLNIKLKFIN